MSHHQDDRPGPYPIGRVGLLTPAEDLPELAGWLVHYRELLATEKVPGAVRQPRISAKLNRYIDSVTTAAQANRANASATSPQITSAVGGAAEPAPPSEQSTTITTAQAAEILGVSARWVRELLDRGEIQGHRTHRGHRDIWQVNRASVLQHKEQDGRNGEHPARPAGGSAGDGQAA